MYKVGDETGEQSHRKGPGGWVDGKLNASQQCALAARSVNCVLGYNKHSIASWSREVIVALSTALVWPHLKCYVKFWAYKDIKWLDSKILWVLFNLNDSTVLQSY